MKVVQELQRVDWNNPGALSVPARAVLGALIFVFIGLAGYYVLIKPLIEEHSNRLAKENTLKQDFEAKQKQAANLKPLTEQLAEMDLMLEQMLKQLPSKTQLANLLTDVSNEALEAGLEVQLFKPQPEVLKEFYAERPISLRMVGSYHQFGQFMSGVATLPRVVILTMHDVSLQPFVASSINETSKATVARGALVLEGKVKTYRYLDDDEQDLESGATESGAATGAAK